MVRFVHGWESTVAHYLLPLLLGDMLDTGLEKVISSTFLSLETDKHLKKQPKCFKWLIALQLENDAISFLKKACLLRVYLCRMWEYRSRLSFKVNLVVFFTSSHFSGKARPRESLVVESHLERVCVGVLSLFFPFSLSVILSLLNIWNDQKKDLGGAVNSVTRKGLSSAGETGFYGL